eukprot:m.263138 g.263138  ORF g.263138 m.263138 type:complete len:108 (+) comp16226_c2_seq33:2468-2791(+)
MSTETGNLDSDPNTPRKKQKQEEQSDKPNNKAQESEEDNDNEIEEEEEEEEAATKQKKYTRRDIALTSLHKTVSNPQALANMDRQDSSMPHLREALGYMGHQVETKT